MKRLKSSIKNWTIFRLIKGKRRKFKTKKKTAKKSVTKSKCKKL